MRLIVVFGARLRAIATWVNTHQGALIAILVAAAVVLRVILVVDSPTPFGYVWDFYTEGVQLLFNTGRLPLAEDCWQCGHPPVFYLAGWPFYALGRWIAPRPSDAVALRWLGGLAMLSGTVTIIYGYRLLRFYRCRRWSLVAGLALLLIFPCLFISSYGPEADIVLTALLSAFIYYLSRYFSAPRNARPFDVLLLGLLAGLAAATKYSGLVGIVSAGIGVGILVLRGPDRLRTIRDGLLVLLVCALVGGWKYADNYRRYGDVLHANGSAAQGFAVSSTRGRSVQWEFTTFRLRELRALIGPHPPAGQLTSFRAYHSVPTALHALAWSDMSFFTVNGRHGSPSQPYPRRIIPRNLTMAVILLGFVPEVLAVIGLAITLKHRVFWPLAIFTIVSFAAYFWWVVPQTSWALKTKYLLFLLPPFAVYVVAGLGWLWRRAPLAGLLGSALFVALVAVAHLYLYAFAAGGL